MYDIELRSDMNVHESMTDFSTWVKFIISKILGPGPDGLYQPPCKTLNISSSSVRFLSLIFIHIPLGFLRASDE